MTNEQLAELIQQGGNDELLPLLWDKTRLLIYQKCNRVWHFYSEKLERFGYSCDDLQQEGYNALIFAVKQYKREKGYTFTTYLNYALKHVVRGLLSGGADVLNQPGTQSLEQPLGENSEGNTLLVGDVVPDERAAEAYEYVDRLDEYNALYEAIDSLPPDQRRVIREHYFGKLTFKQIGERHNYSHERANQIHRKALNALRNGKIGIKLRLMYGENYRSPITYKHKGLAAFKSSRSSEVEDYVERRCGSYSLKIKEQEQPLTAMQKRFCEEYLVDFDPTQAAIRAGYSVKTARITAEKLINQANVNNYIQKMIWE